MITREEVLAAEQLRARAFLDRDVAAIERLFADEIVFTHASGKVDGKQSYLAFMRSGAAVYSRVWHEDIVITLYGDVAVMTGIVAVEVVHDGVPKLPRNRFTAVWVKQPQGLQMVAWQHTAALPRQQ